MTKSNFLTFFLLCCFTSVFSQTTNITKAATIIKLNHNFGLTNPLYDKGSLMTYDAGLVNTDGAAFSFNFVNSTTDTGYKGYPSGTVGGFKSGGVYYPGITAQCGLPVQIKYLNDDLRIRWKVSQQFANDPDDKWWATINVIFDSTAPQYEPIPENRDFDLVIALKQYEQESLSDVVENPTVTNGDKGVFWRFAKTSTGALKTLDLNYNGTVYKWAIRYKYFNYDPATDPKNNKIHVKFIPLDNDNVAPFLDHSLKKFLEAAKANIANAGLPPAKEALANIKVANEDLYIKSIAAGYEVYTGAFTIKNDYFYTVLDTSAPVAPANFTAEKLGSQITLNWDDNTENDIDSYVVYRSVNDGPFTIFAENVNTSEYLDTSTTSGNKYSYYVIARDRSDNDSAPSATKSRSFIKANAKMSDMRYTENSSLLYPNPTTDKLYFESGKAYQAEILDNSGKVVQYIKTDRSKNFADVQSLPAGRYILKLTSQEGTVLQASPFIKK